MRSLILKSLTSISSCNWESLVSYLSSSLSIWLLFSFKSSYCFKSLVLAFNVSSRRLTFVLRNESSRSNFISFWRILLLSSDISESNRKEDSLKINSKYYHDELNDSWRDSIWEVNEYINASFSAQNIQNFMCLDSVLFESEVVAPSLARFLR